MGHTGLELSPKTSGKTALCEEGRAESGAACARRGAILMALCVQSDHSTTADWGLP